jgi:hypothetical protein
MEFDGTCMCETLQGETESEMEISYMTLEPKALGTNYYKDSRFTGSKTSSLAPSTRALHLPHPQSFCPSFMSMPSKGSHDWAH